MALPIFLFTFDSDSFILKSNKVFLHQIYIVMAFYWELFVHFEKYTNIGYVV